MSTIAIHELPMAGALTGAESVPVDTGASTVRTTVAAIRDGLAATAHGHGMADVTDLETVLASKASLASPAFTGSLTAQGAVSLAGAPNSESVRAVPVANAVDRVEVYGAPAGGIPYIRTNGPDSAIPLYLIAKGGASIGFQTTTPGSPQVIITHTPNNTHWIALSGAAAGGIPTVGSSSGRIDLTAVPHLPSFTVATLPVATARGLIHVADGGGARHLAVADGASWRWPDGMLVS